MYSPRSIRTFLTLFIVFIISLSSLAQENPGAINAFKYAFIPNLTYQNGSVDIYGVIDYLKTELSKKGIIILGDNANVWPKEAKFNPCLVGRWFAYHKSGSIANSAKAGFSIRNCKGEVVYENSATASRFGAYYDANVPIAMQKAFKPIEKFDYLYLESLTPIIDFPKVESTTETEESLKKYFDSNTIDGIEGIYQSYQNGGLTFYKLGIIKSSGTYKAIIIESELPQWKAGEVKAYMEPSSLNNLYSVKWLMANKTSVQTFASLESNAILTIELKNSQNEKEDQKFIKMYPTANISQSTKSNVAKASGTGFVISVGGIVGTNAHVISDANRIEIIIKNEIGTFVYNAKVLLNDNKNDVALLQISDSTFKGFSSIPYQLVEKVDVGEKVFTIGYPLNDVMGTNFKVNDGIVSSTSGINDDVRYLQISVPIQPGNSGGPLFNKDGNIIAITSARLNSNAVGTQVENVNYAIKIGYLLNLYYTLPNFVQKENGSLVIGKDLQDQVKVLKNYVCLIKIY
jgi:S1-C subfamily serine protease